MWPDLIAKSKEGGADVIETYAFWNGHEPIRGQVCHLLAFAHLASLCEGFYESY